MTTKPRVRTVRGHRVYDPEPQWFAPAPGDMFTGGWVVYRQRPYQHLYGVRFNSQNLGYLLRFTDGWRWQTTWSPGSGPRNGRTSKATYPTWQAAAARLVRTDVGRRVCRGQKPPQVNTWTRVTGVRGDPWVPKPAEPEEA